MIINPLTILDDMLMLGVKDDEMQGHIMALRVWHLNNDQVKSGTTLVVASRQPAFEDTPKVKARTKDVPTAWELAKAEEDYAQSFQGREETDTEWRRRRDRLRHKVRRMTERIERDDLPPLVKTKAKKDKWQFGGIGSTVQCPHCNAPSGTKCRNMTGGGAYSKVAKPHVPANSSHKRRKEAEQAANTRAEADSISDEFRQANLKERMDTASRNTNPSIFPYSTDPAPEIEPPYSVMNQPA